MYKIKKLFCEKLELFWDEPLFLDKVNNVSYTGREGWEYYKSNVSNAGSSAIVVCENSLESNIISFFSILDSREYIFISKDFYSQSMEYLPLSYRLLPIINVSETCEVSNQLLVCLTSEWQDFKSTPIGKNTFTSSGSTGVPKLIPLSENNINACFTQVYDNLIRKQTVENIVGIHDTSFVIVLPYLYYFVGSSGACFVSQSMKHNYQPIIYASLIIKKGINQMIITVPSILRSIYSLASNEKWNYINIISCGEPLDENMAQNISKRLPLSFHNLYGSTEVAPWIFYLDILDYFRSDYKSIDGIMPIGNVFPGVEIRLKSDTNELMVSGDCVFNGYINLENNDTFAKINDKEYFLTGDSVVMEENGYYYCKGRLNSSIKIGGKFLNPIIIESAVKEKIEENEIIISPCYKTSKLVIYVFSTENELTKERERSIISHVKEALPSKVPVKVEHICGKPEYLSSGKINRKYYQEMNNLRFS